MKAFLKIVTVLFITILVSLCLQLEGCQKKLIRDHKIRIVEGFVKDSQSLIPIVGADVFFDDHPYDPCPKTDSIGYYKVVEILGGPELCKITIKAQGYKTQEINIILKPSQTQRLDFF